MRKGILFFMMMSCYWQFTACNTASPEKYFDIAVLNCNLMHGFAGEGLQRELESPSGKMIDGNKNNFAPMKRKEVVDDKIQFISAALDELQQLKETDDTRDMLQASLALYKYVLPVYKKEYQHLANLYDGGSPREDIQAYTQSISDNYYQQYEKLLNKLTIAGKAFAVKHNIKVTWDVKTSPQ